MKRQLFFSLCLLLAATCHAQLRTNAGYECEEQLFPRFDKASRLWGYKNIIRQWRVEPAFDKADPFTGKLAVVQRGTRYGLINCDGFLVAHTQYDEIQNFVNGRGWAKQGGLWGVLDEKGKLFVPPAFEEIKPISPRHDFTWVKKKGLWGIFYKERGKMLVEPAYEGCRSISDSLVLGLKGGYQTLIYVGTGQAIYDSCTNFERVVGNLFRFSYRHKEGLIDASGNVRLLPEYDSIAHYPSFFLVKKGGKWGIADSYARLQAQPQFSQALGADGALIAIEKEGKWGMAIPNGKIIIPLDYQGALPQFGSYYALKKGNSDSAWALIRSNELLTKARFIYKNIQYPFGSLVADATLPNGAHELINLKNGATYTSPLKGYIRDPKFSAIYPYSIDDKSHDTLWGYLNPATFASLPLSGSDHYQLVKEGFIITGKAQKQGILVLSSNRKILADHFSKIEAIAETNILKAHTPDSTYLFSEAGKALFQFPCQDLIPVKSSLFIFKEKGKFGLIQKPSNVVLKPTFDFLQPAGVGQEAEGLPLLAIKKDKAVLISQTGEELGSTYDSLFYLGNTLFAARQSGQYLLLEKVGKVQQSPTYLAIKPFSEGLLLVQTQAGWQYLNRSLKPAFPDFYSQATPFVGGTAIVWHGGKAFEINKAGKKLQALSAR